MDVKQQTQIKLNPDKTEFILISDDQIRNSLELSFPVNFISNIMESVKSVRKIGGILDADKSMQRHIAHLCCVCYYHLRELQRVHRYLTHETAVKVANAMVSSHLDNCNCLLYNTKLTNIYKIQRIQSTFFRIVCKLNKFSHVTNFLHWLSIQYCILFKCKFITYKAINFS